MAFVHGLCLSRFCGREGRFPNSFSIIKRDLVFQEANDQFLTLAHWSTWWQTVLQSSSRVALATAKVPYIFVTAMGAANRVLHNFEFSALPLVGRHSLQ